MQIEETRMHLATLKLYMNKMEAWARQANQMIYEVEKSLLDLEDELFCLKYGPEYSMLKLNEAATHTFGPARLGADRCAKEDIAPAAFIQEFSYSNNVTSKRSR